MSHWLQCSFVGHGITWADSWCTTVEGGGGGGGHKDQDYPDGGYLWHFKKDSPHPIETEFPFEVFPEKPRKTLHLKKRSLDDEIRELFQIDLKEQELLDLKFRTRISEAELSILEKKRKRKKMLLLLLAA